VLKAAAAAAADDNGVSVGRRTWPLIRLACRRGHGFGLNQRPTARLPADKRPATAVRRDGLAAFTGRIGCGGWTAGVFIGRRSRLALKHVPGVVDRAAGRRFGARRIRLTRGAAAVYAPLYMTDDDVRVVARGRHVNTSQ